MPQWRGSGHSVLFGNSIGAAYVSGCAALVKTLNPAWGYHEIKEHLLASGTPLPALEGRCQTGAVLNVANAVLGPIELAVDARALTWASLNDAVLEWKLRYRAAFCANAVALFRPHGDAHWRELAHRARQRAEDDHPRNGAAALDGHAAHRLPRVELLLRRDRADDRLKWGQTPFPGIGV